MNDNLIPLPPQPPSMSDDQVVELLALLALYCRVYPLEPAVDDPAGDVTGLRIRELAGDLYDSLPHPLQRDAAANARICKADGLTLRLHE